FRCDIYALGATLYMAVTGELPFRARGIASILQKKFKNELTPPRQLVPTLGERTERAILRALRLDPKQRHASCREFVDDLTGKGQDTAGEPATAPTAAAPSWREPGKPLPKERRAWVRYPYGRVTACNLNASIHPEGDEAAGHWQGTVQDLSVAGIGVLLERRFEPGTVLAVELRSPDHSVTRTLEMCVIRVSRAGQKRWLVGCVFTQPLSKEELRQLL